jgi:hypothetical protein
MEHRHLARPSAADPFLLPQPLTDQMLATAAFDQAMAANTRIRAHLLDAG